MRLLDHVSGPAAAATRSLKALNATTLGLMTGGSIGRGMREYGRGIRSATYNTAALSGAMTIAAGAAARSIFEFEKMGNAVEAVGMISEHQRKLIEGESMDLNALFPHLNKDIMGAGFELMRAGMSFETMMGTLRDSLNLALAGDLQLPETADIMTNIMQSLRMPQETMESAAASAKRTSDVLAYAANKSNTNISKMGITFKYAAPMAAVLGVEMEELAALTMVMANNGIKGSDAGTGLRFAMMRMLKPSKDMNRALERLNMNINDYITKGRQASSSEIIQMMALEGVDAKGLGKQIDALLEDPSLRKSPARLAAALSQMVSKELGEGSIIDRQKLIEGLEQSLTVLGGEIDFMKFLGDLQNKEGAESLLGHIFGVRHGGKVAAALAGDFVALVDEVMARSVGAADAMSRKRQKGIVGVWARFTASLENLAISVARSGVLDAVATGITTITNGLRDLSEMNPELLKLSTYAALAVAAIAPLGFALSGVASAASLAINPLILAGAALAYLAATNWKSFTAGMSALKSSFLTSIDPKTVETLKRWGDAIKNFAASMLGLDGTELTFLQMMTEVGRAAADSIDWLVQKIDAMLVGINEVLGYAGADLGFLAKWGGIALLASLGLGLAAKATFGLTRSLGILFALKISWKLVTFLAKLTKATIGLKAAAAGVDAIADAAGEGDGRKGKGKRKGGRVSRLLRGAGPLAVVAGGVAAISSVAGRRGEWADKNRLAAEDQLMAQPVAPRYANEAAMRLEGAKTPAIKPKLDTVDLLSKTMRTSDQVRDMLNVTARPIVDTSSLDAALSKAVALRRHMSSMGSLVGQNASRGTGTRWVQPGVDGARASGGRVSRGKTYLTGERGPELVTMGGSGYVNNARDTKGGGVTMNVNINVDGSRQDVAREIAAHLQRALARSRAVSLNGRSVVA